MGFRVSISLAKNQAGPGMTPLKKVVLEDVSKDDAKAAYKAAIGATLAMDDANVDTSGETFVLHGRIKITDENKKPWLTIVAEWPNVNEAAAVEMGKLIDAGLAA